MTQTPSGDTERGQHLHQGESERGVMEVGQGGHAVVCTIQCSDSDYTSEDSCILWARTTNMSLVTFILRRLVKTV